MPYKNAELKKAADRLYYLTKRKGVEDNKAIYQSQKDKDPGFLARRRAIQAKSRAKKKAENPEAYAAAKRSEYCKRKLKNPEGLAKNNRYARRKRASTPQGKIAHAMRARLYQCFWLKSVSKSLQESIGCDWAALVNHIESLWQPGMDWENYSLFGWHIDHIVPVSAFDLRDPEQFAQCWHYTNLQPLWSKDNWRKSNKQSGDL
jgi:hypothetical protein